MTKQSNMAKRSANNIMAQKPAMHGAEIMVIVGFAEEIASTSEWLNYYKQKTRRKNENQG